MAQCMREICAGSAGDLMPGRTIHSTEKNMAKAEKISRKDKPAAQKIDKSVVIQKANGIWTAWNAVGNKRITAADTENGCRAKAIRAGWVASLALLISLSGCAGCISPKAQCEKYGFISGSDAFAACVQQEVLSDHQRVVINQASGNMFVRHRYCAM